MHGLFYHMVGYSYVPKHPFWLGPCDNLYKVSQVAQTSKLLAKITILYQHRISIINSMVSSAIWDYAIHECY